MSNRDKFLCLDCGKDTGREHEHYFLFPEIWYLIHDSDKGMLCICCAEKRLERPLISTDFAPVWINDPKKNKMSTRLLNRIRSKPKEAA